MSTRRSRAAALAILLVPLVACGGERAAPVTPEETVARHGRVSAPVAAKDGEDPRFSATPEAGLPPMMPGRIHAPTVGEVACPSLDFEEFIRAFFNSGDLQVRFTAKPVRYKVSYYDYHNTEPGDPSNPQWETFERNRPIHDRYRYDAQLKTYVLDISRLRPGQRWTGVDAEGQHVPNPIAELHVRKVSDTEYAVDTPNGITTFSRQEDCWYLTHDWTLDPFEGCEWPGGCRALREYEAPYYEDG